MSTRNSRCRRLNNQFAVQEVLSYSRSPIYPDIATFPELPRVLCDVVLSVLSDHVDNELAEHLDKMGKRYETTYGLLGLYAAEMGLYTDLGAFFHEALRPTSQIDTVTLRRRYLDGSSIIGLGQEATPAVDECIHALRDVLQEHSDYFAPPVFDAPLWPFSIQ